jgi:hypothetical protein
MTVHHPDYDNSQVINLFGNHTTGRLLSQREIPGFSDHGFSEERERKLVDGRTQCAKETGG